MLPYLAANDSVRNILACIDFSERSQAVADLAALQARAFSARLWLVHVAAPDPGFIGYDAGSPSVRLRLAQHLRQCHRDIQALAQSLRSQGTQVTSHLIRGQAIKAILNKSSQVQADLIVLGAHSHGLMYRVLLGSVSQAVLQKSTIPVMVIPCRLPLH